MRVSHAWIKVLLRDVNLQGCRYDMLQSAVAACMHGAMPAWTCRTSSPLTNGV